MTSYPGSDRQWSRPEKGALMKIRWLLSGCLVFPVSAATSGCDGGASIEESRSALSQAVDESGAPEQLAVPVPGSLRTVPIPEPSDLDDYVANRRAAIRLGKAFYWDMQVGSDGLVACATCHHKAGTDGRTKNQIRPRSPLTAGATFVVGGPNSRVKASDFPFHRLSDPDDADSTVLFDGSSNRVASAGVALRRFTDIQVGSAEDLGVPIADPVFILGGINVRRAAIVNAPTNINAVFNLRQLAAGQAYNTFNGANGAGTRDPRALIVKVIDGVLTPIVVRIDNASLASQSTGPPLDAVEMSYAGRTFPKLGKKLLALTPLAKQRVASDDSVLGPLANCEGTGLTTDYPALIRKAFRREFWDAPEMVTYSGGSSADRVAEGAAADAGIPSVHPHPGRPLTTDEYTAMEANFSLFWGLALQLYQSTLVSDRSPFDRFREGRAKLTPAQRRGMRIFFGHERALDGTRATCANCHGGPEFTSASVSLSAQAPLERIEMPDGGLAVRDTGFMNIAVRPSTEGRIQAGADPVFGPFSQTLWAQAGHDIGFDLDPPLQPTERTALVGAIKASTLRNVELTGPYFHNGGASTLRQVVDFYVRGGDFTREEADVDPDLRPLPLSERGRTDLVEFLLALTDERVRKQSAPFDHPQIFVPDGHIGDDTEVVDDGTGRALDNLVEIPAVGRQGGRPLRPFLRLDPQEP
jgi:cytochrome c peroxidase